MTGDKPVDDAAISSGSEYGSIEDFAAALPPEMQHSNRWMD
ncbi:MAG: hypothetical protein CM15mP48_1370 [Candidatus Poseidoniales archaeon]|nr:MAG: hypothetical protein CM15mP48_1370 [Candidatus Poseidoniales archaeon]